MNLFTRNSPYYYLRKYLLLLLKHPVYQLLISVYCRRHAIHHRQIAIIVEALTVNVWGAISCIKWLNTLRSYVMIWHINVARNVTPGHCWKEMETQTETIFSFTTKRLALQCNETVNITSWRTRAVNWAQYLLVYLLFSLSLQPSAGYGLLVLRDFLITHNDAPQSARLLWTRD
jgi:hypothetical protein